MEIEAKKNNNDDEENEEGKEDEENNKNILAAANISEEELKETKKKLEKSLAAMPVAKPFTSSPFNYFTTSPLYCRGGVKIIRHCAELEKI